MRTRKLIARNAHAITRCAHAIRVRKSAHLNESEYAYFSTRDSLSCQGLRQIAPCTMHYQSILDLYLDRVAVLLTRSLAHCSCSWPTQLGEAVLVVGVHTSPVMSFQQRAHARHCPCIARAILKQSQLFEHDGIYRIEWYLAKLKLSNELECRSIYGMTYNT